MKRNALHDVTPRDDLRAAAVTFFGALGGWAYDTWAELNARHFGARLPRGPILWGLTPHGHALGFYSSGENSITLHRSLRDERSNAWNIGSLLGERFAADVILHEMVHQAIHTLHGQWPRDSHNNDLWCSEIVRISADLGLAIQAKPIRQKRVDKHVTWYVEPGYLTRRDIAHWPHSIRPPGYYEKPALGLLRQMDGP